MKKLFSGLLFVIIACAVLSQVKSFTSQRRIRSQMQAWLALEDRARAIASASPPPTGLKIPNHGGLGTGKVAAFGWSGGEVGCSGGESHRCRGTEALIPNYLVASSAEEVETVILVEEKEDQTAPHVCTVYTTSTGTSGYHSSSSKHNVYPHLLTLTFVDLTDQSLLAIISETSDPSPTCSYDYPRIKSNLQMLQYK